jgi:hypothetical protein
MVVGEIAFGFIEGHGNLRQISLIAREFLVTSEEH